MKTRIFLLIGLAIVIAGVIYLVKERGPVTEKTAKASISAIELLTPAEEVTYWQERIDSVGGEEGYQEFKDIYAEDPNIGFLHQKSHLFGEALYRAMGVDGVPVCDSNFGFGCYHSFFGFAILDKGIAVLPELDKACIEAYGNKGLGCQHGIGHGVIVEMGYDKLAAALDECSRLDWQGPIGGCTSGVLMEFNHHTMEETGPRQPIDNDYHYPCDQVESRFIEACYFEQAAWWSALTNTDYIFIGQECEKALTLLGKEACYRGTGNLAAGVLSYSIPDVLKACQMMPNTEGEILCVEGAAWIMSYEPSRKDDWTELCEPYEGAYYERCIRSHDFI